MKYRATSPELAQRLQHLEKEITRNERRQRRLQRALAGRKPIRTAAAPPLKDLPRHESPPVYESKTSAEKPVKFDHDNAPIFMSGSLEALDARHVTPTERRNRFLLLLFFVIAVLVGVFYMLIP